MCDAKFCGSPLDKLGHLAAANRMFVREKRINGYAYLYLVETVREGGRAKQRIIKNLGRKEAVTASGALERLATSVARYAERALVLSQIDAGSPDGLACKRIGAPLLFGRLWEETGCRAVSRISCPDADSSSRVERATSPPSAPDHGLGLGPGLREVAVRLRHPRYGRPEPPPPLPRHGGAT